MFADYLLDWNGRTIQDTRARPWKVSSFLWFNPETAVFWLIFASFGFILTNFDSFWFILRLILPHMCSKREKLGGMWKSNAKSLWEVTFGRLLFLTQFRLILIYFWNLLTHFALLWGLFDNFWLILESFWLIMDCF